MARVAILVASDKGAAGQRVDLSGEAIASRCAAAGHDVVRREIVADDRGTIAATLASWSDAAPADVILTTGGTGLTPRDITPEATRDIAERDVPAIPIALARAGLEKTPYAALTRGIAVTRARPPSSSTSLAAPKPSTKASMSSSHSSPTSPNSSPAPTSTHPR